MTRRFSFLAPLALGLLPVLLSPAAALEPFDGNWRIIGASDTAGTPAEAAPPVGESLTFLPDRVDGPHPLGCGGAAYDLVFVPPPGLFQGSLSQEEAEAVAERLRLLPEAPTLRVDCDGGSFDYHALAEAPPRLVIMLDGRLVMLERTGD